MPDCIRFIVRKSALDSLRQKGQAVSLIQLYSLSGISVVSSGVWGREEEEEEDGENLIHGKLYGNDTKFGKDLFLCFPSSSV